MKPEKIDGGWHIIWAIAWKDILDSLKNKLIISMIVGLSLMLLMPKLMGLMIESPVTQLMVYAPSESRLLIALEDSPEFEVEQTNSVAQLEETIGRSLVGLDVEIGIVIPADFDQRMRNGDNQLVGYVAWANRTKATKLEAEFAERFSILLDEPVQVEIAGNYVYPTQDSTLLLGILTWSTVIVILMMGIALVPHLLFEEKRTKTMDALLVSPANAGQVVAAKALAGVFYMLVAAGVVFALNWVAVVHWGAALVFALSGTVFCVALGLVLGSFYDRQEEITGLVMVLTVLFAGAMFADGMLLNIPAAVAVILPWVPSVVLADILTLAYLEHVTWAQILPGLGGLLVLSMLLYGAVIWKIRRSDR